MHMLQSFLPQSWELHWSRFDRVTQLQPGSKAATKKRGDEYQIVGEKRF